MQYMSPENADERRRELQRRAEAARLARQVRRSRPRAGAAGGGRPSGDLLARGGLSWGWRRLGRRVAGALAEGARVQRRVAVLSASQDRTLPHPHQPPETYQEFLARTAGPLLCEPPAVTRSRGRPVG